MKKILFILFFLSISISIFSQTYHPLVREGLSWETYFYDASQTCTITGDAFYFFNGDTIISGNHYKNIWGYRMVPMSPGQFCPDYWVDTNISSPSNLWLREDTLAKKVFFYDFLHQKDSLMYDFSLRIGDSITYNVAHFGVIHQYISSIDSAHLNTGEWRKRFNLSGGWGGGYYIEGIGGSSGVQFPIYFVVAGIKLGCVKEYNIELLSGRCNPVLGIEDFKNNTAIQLAPNPFDNNLKVSIDSKEPSLLILYDILSNKVIEQNFTSSVTLNTTQLPSGVYICELTNNMGIIKIGKVMKY